MSSSSAPTRVTVWVQQFHDRTNLVLQWLDPDTHHRKSKSAGTADRAEAEQRAKDLEYERTHGKHVEASRMTWERFRELFEAEYASAKRANTQRNFRVTLDLFELVCQPRTLRAVNERTVSAFAAGLRARPGIRGEPMQPGTIKVRLQFLHTALQWAEDQKLIPECRGSRWSRCRRNDRRQSRARQPRS